MGNRLADLEIPPPAEQTPKRLGAFQRGEIEKCWPVRNKLTYIGGLLERLTVERYGVWTSLTETVRTGMPQNDRSMVTISRPSMPTRGRPPQAVRAAVVLRV
jgi:hypothetical protein